MNSKNQLTIPQNLQLFSESTALICLAHDRAKVYEVYKDSLKEVSFLHTSDTDYQYSDKESFSHAEGSQTIFFKPGTEEHNKEHYLRVFLNYFSEKLRDLSHQYGFRDIYLFVPNNIKNIVLEKIPNSIRGKIHIIPGNVMHEHPLELLKRIEGKGEHLSS
jgi:hypothetical protein